MADLTELWPTTTIDEALRRGDDRTLRVTLTLDGDAWEPPVGTVLRFTARTTLVDTHDLTDDSTAVFTKTTEASGGITIDGNVAEITIAAVDTNGLPRDVELYCDVQATVNGERRTLAAFVLPVVRDVTRA